MPLDTTRVPATIRELRGYLLEDENDQTRDPRIILMANSAIRRIEEKTNTCFLARDIVESHTGNGRALLFTRYRFILSITSVTVGGVAVSDVTYDARLGMLTRSAGVFTAGTPVVISYRVGFEPADYPADINETFLAYTKWLFDEKLTGSVLATSVTVGQGSISIKSGMPDTIKEAIAPWRDARC